ncbi:MAG: FeoB-associated Cys-rich membrane protein [Clostridia bacterium]|nr:FeoB-associated Cys-rich membrane protein [Clostridia bacterium]
MENIALIAAIIIIVGLAAFYVYKAKKSGNKCIGCPDGCSCGHDHKSNCSCGSEEE